jgi:hypothetical protein
LRFSLQRERGWDTNWVHFKAERSDSRFEKAKREGSFFYFSERREKKIGFSERERSLRL